MAEHGGGGAAVELAEAIESLRAQLEAARRLAPPGSLRFEVGPVELEFQVELVSGAEVSGGAKFYVMSAGGRQNRENRTTHSVRLTLTPQDPAGGPLEVSGNAVGIPGQ
ncbi:trypco2 family protein [Streptomyces kebangsaanensis]|uniref:trypco2 family protein n=1 Tax=Streptomyces kebangsaanensis TaxID=864058 RepID=UPI00093B60C8|nr:trypco2 family protein [Streptomyces kebangsaanensis]